MHTDDYRFTINEIVKSKKIISSLLYGIILAEAYGVPTVFCNPKGYSLFKFWDYYELTGRKLTVVAKSPEDAMSVIPQELPAFSQMREKLLSVFPYDLWN